MNFKDFERMIDSAIEELIEIASQEEGEDMMEEQKQKTPCEELGYKVGDKFEVLEDCVDFSKGQIVHLYSDDGSECPFFVGEGGYIGVEIDNEVLRGSFVGLELVKKHEGLDEEDMEDEMADNWEQLCMRVVTENKFQHFLESGEDHLLDYIMKNLPGGDDEHHEHKLKKAEQEFFDVLYKMFGELGYAVEDCAGIRGTEYQVFQWFAEDPQVYTAESLDELDKLFWIINSLESYA